MSDEVAPGGIEKDHVRISQGLDRCDSAIGIDRKFQCEDSFFFVEESFRRVGRLELRYRRQQSRERRVGSRHLMWLLRNNRDAAAAWRCVGEAALLALSGNLETSKGAVFSHRFDESSHFRAAIKTR